MKEFNTKNEKIVENLKNTKVYFDFNTKAVNNKIVVDAEISSFDNFVNEIKEKGKDIDWHFSNLDAEKLYNLLCYEELNKQSDENAKYNPSRSWGQLKSALNVWFSTRLGLDRTIYYSIIVNELLRETSKLKTTISKALKEFRKEYEIEVKEKEEKEIFKINVPAKEVSFTDDFERIEKISKNAYEEFYNRRQYLGKENEEKFIKFIESQKNILWWHKQDDNGRNVFAIEYYDTQEKKERLFYPDFIIRTKNKVYLLDPKNNITAKSQETADKSKALQKWIKNNKSKYKFEIIGGIVIEKYPDWKINDSGNYVYENEKDWDVLNFK